jgi:outer membrane protein TolC
MTRGLIRQGGLVVLAIGFIGWSPRAAEAQTPLALSLEDAITRALEQSPRLAEARAREAAAALVPEIRAAEGRPTVNAIAGILRTNHVEEFGVRQPDGSLRVIFPDLPTNYRVRTEAVVPLYTGGRVDALVRAAEAEGHAVSAEVAGTDADVRLVTTEFYWALVTARERRGVLEQAMVRAEAMVGDARGRVDAGVASPDEVLTAEAQRARQSVGLIRAGHEATMAEARLVRWLGLPADQSIAPTTPIAQAAPGVADLAARPVPALVALAIESRPERQGRFDREAAYRAAAEAAAAATKPRVVGVAAFEPARPNPRFVPRSDRWQTSWDLGVNVTWPIWDGGRSRAEATASLAQAEAVRQRGREFEAAVSLEVRERVLDLVAGREAIAASTVAVQAATEARRVLGERFAAGVATSTDVLGADVGLLEAELERASLLAALRIAEARFTRAIGGRP